MAVATKINTGKTLIVIGSLDSDYNYTTDFADYSNGISVHSIQFVPSGINDKCVLVDNNGSVTLSPEIFMVSSQCKFETKYFGGAHIKLYYDVSDSNNTCTASANAKIVVNLDPSI
jgi:hypothetical protein